MKALFFSLCFINMFLLPCNSTEGRRALVGILTRTCIEEKLERLWQDAYVHEDDVAAKAYDEFNALINDHSSVHSCDRVKLKLCQLELTDSSGMILEHVREAWKAKEQKIQRLLSFRIPPLRLKSSEKSKGEQ